MTATLPSPPLSDQTEAESQLIALAAALGAAGVPGLSAQERARLTRGLPTVPASRLAAIRCLVRDGADPLGEAFTALRSPADRRPLGATYTPGPIVKAMVRWAVSLKRQPERIVDPGVGSGRFLLEAGRRFGAAELVGVEVDPLAALIARANLAAAGFGSRARVELSDYRSLRLPAAGGRTLFIGNPPYVRHHLLSAESKEWLVREAAKLGLGASQLAGLHVHFFLATARLAAPGDFGAFITAAEWLDVNYGQLVRDLFLARLGGQSIVVVEPTARPFPDAATTAAITTFEIGAVPQSVRLRRVLALNDLGSLQGGALVRRERLSTEHRWTNFLRNGHATPPGFVQLGDLCRVHRGQVTGANRVWIAGDHSRELPPSFLFPTVTKARELFALKGTLDSLSNLRRVIDLPVELESIDGAERKAVDRFLKWARGVGADQGYIAKHRRAWWSVGLREPPPIMATYMARRPPAFVFNRAQARYINIAHGIYPREDFGSVALERLANYLSSATHKTRGRTYAGGLMKFEPREMERIAVPGPELLAAGAFA